MTDNPSSQHVVDVDARASKRTALADLRGALQIAKGVLLIARSCDVSIQSGTALEPYRQVAERCHDALKAQEHKTRAKDQPNRSP